MNDDTRLHAGGLGAEQRGAPKGIPVFYFRSSSYNAWDWCQQKYFLSFTLGFKDSTHFSAAKGTLIHKALELLACKKLAEQDKQEMFVDEELQGSWETATFSLKEALDAVWKHYTATNPTGHEWGAADYSFCEESVTKVMEMCGGIFNPLKRNVIYPEKYFDFCIEEDWAKYDYTIQGNQFSGYLNIRGTLDLVSDIGDGVIELTDYKSGGIRDWNKGRDKTWTDFRNDPQLRIYHYALSRLQPDAKEILISIIFPNSGGAYTLDFNRSDLPKTLKLIRRRFEEIKNTTKPRLIWGDPKQGWKCHKFCAFSKPAEKFNGSICQHIRRETESGGIDKVIDKYMNLGKINTYEGGGRTR